jgi:hypothetical protein
MPFGYCTHGSTFCVGSPDRGLPPCLPSEHIYCAHGVDQRTTTSRFEQRCPYCRGVRASQVNRTTYNPRIPRNIPPTPFGPVQKWGPVSDPGATP